MSSNRKVPPTEPFYIKIHPQDNVAIIANTNGLPTDTRFPCGLILAEHVPQGHKVALVDIAAGQPVLRYDATIVTRCGTFPWYRRIRSEPNQGAVRWTLPS